ncbi:MAG: hypothetical protein ACXAEX_01740 [Promethearchaeota archaeon]|jgi:hypothetical protein
MSDNNPVFQEIKNMIQNPKINSKNVLKALLDLRTNKKIAQPSDSEFFEIIGEAFRMNPDFFMKEIYNSFIEKIGKIIGVEKRREMGKYIIEKYCLAEDEHILYEFIGNVKQTELLEQKPSGKYKMDTLPLTISVRFGDVFITNYRIIAQGTLKVSGGEKTSGAVFYLTSLWVFTGKSKRSDRKEAFIDTSPLFGYQFPIKNHTGLDKNKFLNMVAYVVNINNRKCTIAIKPTVKSNKNEDRERIFDLLRKNVDEVLDTLNEIYEFEKSEKFKRKLVTNFIKGLRKSEEYTDMSDSDYLDIIKKTVQLDKEFFFTNVYPKMMSWDFPEFLSVKDQVKSLVEGLRDDIKYIKE